MNIKIVTLIALFWLIGGIINIKSFLKYNKDIIKNDFRLFLGIVFCLLFGSWFFIAFKI